MATEPTGSGMNTENGIERSDIGSVSNEIIAQSDDDFKLVYIAFFPWGSPKFCVNAKYDAEQNQNI